MALPHRAEHDGGWELAMEALPDRVEASGAAPADILYEVRRGLLLRAESHARRIRQNLIHAMQIRGLDPGRLGALSGVATNTIRGFVKERKPKDSNISNVILMALTVGLTLGDLDRPTEEFVRFLASRGPSIG
jgi:hypothetical protein